MKKLPLIILVCILYASQTICAQNLKPDSIFNWGKSGWELPADMISDDEGNFYIAGSFSEKMSLGIQMLESIGKYDIFLAKFSPDMQLIWAKNIGGLEDDNAYSLLFSDNKLYLAGSFRKQIDFNNGAISLKGKGLTDVFLAQMDGNGQIKWAKAFSSSAPAQKAFLQADSTGNVWIAGTYTKPIEAGGMLISNGDKKGIYLAGFNAAGGLLQGSHFSSNAEISLNGFSMDKKDNFYFAGSFTENIEILGQSLNSNGKSDGFVAKLNNEVKLQWLKNPGGAYDDEIKGLDLDAKGNAYAVGEFKYSIELDKTYTAPQNTDAFIIKYSPDGKLCWSNQLGTNGESYNTATQIEMATNGKFYVSGAFKGKIQNTPEVKSLGNSKNAFLARFNTDGNREWILGTGSQNENKLWIRQNTKTEGLFISGYFSETFKLGDFEIKNQNFKDIFFGSLVDCDLATKVTLGNDTMLCGGLELKAKGEFPYYLWSNEQTGNSIEPLKTGDYWVMATDKYGCQSADTIKVHLLPLPKIDLGNDTSICQGQIKTIDAKPGFTAYLWDNGSKKLKRNLDETGDYWLKITDSLGCMATDTFKLLVNSLPEFELGKNIELPANQVLNLKPMLYEGDYEYLWSTGYTGNELKMPMKLFTSPTTISLTVVDQNQCSYTDELLVSQGGNSAWASDTNMDNLDNGYKIYPNPSKGRFHISSELTIQTKQIDIYSPAGILVKRLENVQFYPVEVDLGGQVKGTYLIKLQDEDGIKEFKVVME